MWHTYVDIIATILLRIRRQQQQQPLYDSLIQDNQCSHKGKTFLPGVATPGDECPCTSGWCGHEGQSDHVRSSKKPILCRLTMSNFPLNLLTVSQEMQSSLSWFHPSITLSQKKHFRGSRWHRCFTILTEWPLVDDTVFHLPVIYLVWSHQSWLEHLCGRWVNRTSKSESQLGLNLPINILNISRKSARFRLKPGFHYPSWRPELTARIDG